jgi:hypothetical protein
VRTIHKFTLDASEPGKKVINTSALAQVLHVEAQGQNPVHLLSIWFDLDDQWPRRDRMFEFFVTGGAPPADARYISTHLFLGGSYVLHLYEVYA